MRSAFGAEFWNQPARLLFAFEARQPVILDPAAYRRRTNC